MLQERYRIYRVGVQADTLDLNVDSDATVEARRYATRRPERVCRAARTGTGDQDVNYVSIL